MKWFAILLSYIIFLTLITNSAQSTAVDDSDGNEMVSEDVDKLNAVPTKDSKYKIYLNTVVRNTQGELISVAEGSWCKLFEIDCSVHMHHEITDYAFDTLLGEKEIITIDNMMSIRGYLIQVIANKLECGNFMSIQVLRILLSWRYVGK